MVGRGSIQQVWRAGFVGGSERERWFGSASAMVLRERWFEMRERERWFERRTTYDDCMISSFFPQIAGGLPDNFSTAVADHVGTAVEEFDLSHCGAW